MIATRALDKRQISKDLTILFLTNRQYDTHHSKIINTRGVALSLGSINNNIPRPVVGTTEGGPRAGGNDENQGRIIEQNDQKLA